LTTFFENNKTIISSAAYLIVAILLLAWLGPIVGEQRGFRLVQAGITGVLVGGVYALIALGIVIINKASGVFNFAHGWMMLVGGLVFHSYFVNTNFPIAASFGLALVTVLLFISTQGKGALRNQRYLVTGAIAVVILTTLMSISLGIDEFKWVRSITGAVVSAAMLGLIVERFTIRPLIGQPLFAAVLMTLAIAEVLNGFTQLAWGSQPKNLPIFATINPLGLPQTLPPFRIDATESLGGVILIQKAPLFAFGLALLAFLLFVLFFRFTNIGLSMRAMAEDQQLAQSVGLRVNAILAIAWGIAVVLAGTAGVLQGGATNLALIMPFTAIRAFPAVLLGGLESIEGALIGGLIVGLTEQYATLLFPGSQAGDQLAPFIVLMAVLIIRPEGLFGQKRIERI